MASQMARDSRMRVSSHLYLLNGVHFRARGHHYIAVKSLHVGSVMLRDVRVCLAHLVVLMHLVVDVHQLVVGHRVQLAFEGWIFLHRVPELKCRVHGIRVDVCLDGECVGLQRLVFQLIEQLQYGAGIVFSGFDLIQQVFVACQSLVACSWLFFRFILGESTVLSFCFWTSGCSLVWIMQID